MINMKKRSDTNYITPFNYYELGIGCILDVYVYHMYASLYASTDAAGTYIGQSLVLSNAEVPSFGGVNALTVTLVRLLQLLKAYPPMLVTPLGNVMLVRLVHL